MSKIVSTSKKITITPRGRVFSELTGNYKSAFKGSGIEFDDLRLYEPGDNVRDIDWNSTARTGDVHVKKYRETRDLNILFAIDISSSMTSLSDEFNSKPNLVHQFVDLISLVAINSNDRIGAMLFNENVRVLQRFQKGRQSRVRILEAVDSAYENNHFVGNNIENELRFLLNRFKKKSVLFLLTDKLDIESTAIKKILKANNLKHELIVVKLPEMDYSAFEGQEVDIQDIETGEIVRVLFDKNIIESYGKLLNKKNRDLVSFCNKNNIGLIKINLYQTIPFQVLSFFKHYSRNRSR